MRIFDNDDIDQGGDDDDDEDDNDEQGGGDDEDDDDDEDSRLAADQIPGRRQVATCVTPLLISYIHSYFTHFTVAYIFYIFHNILHPHIFHTFYSCIYFFTIFYNISMHAKLCVNFLHWTTVKKKKDNNLYLVTDNSAQQCITLLMHA